MRNSLTSDLCTLLLVRYGTKNHFCTDAGNVRTNMLASDVGCFSPANSAELHLRRPFVCSRTPEHQPGGLLASVSAGRLGADFGHQQPALLRRTENRRSRV